MSRHGYEPAFLAGRKVYWCPSYEGHLAYCPQPSDPDSHTFCCKSYYLGHTEKPSCCIYALPIGTIVALVLSCIILLSILLFLTCWCLPCCPLNKNIAQNHDINERNLGRIKSF